MAPLDDENQKLYTHFTHNHPLKLAVRAHTSDATCSGCNKIISVGKVYYTCNPCNYSLHSSCYKMPIFFRHKSEPAHDLNLILMQSFMCRACGLEGSGLCYHCRTCAVNYHTLCIRMPLTVSSASHPHDLKIQFAPPYGQDVGFRCDVCKKTSSNRWLYRCSECRFDVHLNCVFAATVSPPENLARTESRGPVHSISSGAPSNPTSWGCESSDGKWESQNSTLAGPVSPSMIGDSPLLRDSRFRILEALDQRVVRVQRSRIEQNHREENGVRTNIVASSSASVGK